MDIIYIVLIVLLCIIVLLFVLAIFFHHMLFGHRFKKDELVKGYSLDDYNLDKEELSFYVQGKKLNGNIYSYKSDEYKGLIIYAHGMDSDHISYIQDIEYFASKGYLVYGFDYYGTSSSEGSNLLGLAGSLMCLDKCIDSIVKNDKLNKYDLYVIGHSWGGFASSNILKYQPKVKKIVCISGFCSLNKMICSALPKPMWIIIPFIQMVDFVKCGKYSLSKSYKVLNKTKSKALLLHSKDDFLVRYKYGAKVVQDKVKNSNVKYLIVDNKVHNPHYASSAIEGLTEYYANTAKLKNDKDALRKYKETVDYKSLGTLDYEVMDKILEFIEE